jgi:hypothetical protein
LLKELIHYRGNKKVILSRPCVYGVFSGPLGGFAPRDHLCVGCLRCTTQYPEMVQVLRNPERERLGDSYFTPELVDTVIYEAQTGRVPVKGAGYRGKFGGAGWDGMWTDMSEIVRPTRDGIHGREFISTSVDIGEKPGYLEFDAAGRPRTPVAGIFSIPVPFVFDPPPVSAASQTLQTVLGEAARQLETLAILPLSLIAKFALDGRHIAPLVTAQDRDSLPRLRLEPALIELVGWDKSLYQELRSRFPHSVVALRLRYGEDLLAHVRAGVRVFHLVADYHGRGRDGGFVLDLIREVHQTLVDAGCRDEVTLMGSGGIIAAEHLPKAIICGLDLIALDTPVLVALQAKFTGECVNLEKSRFELPSQMTTEWGVQRIKNLAASWRDQLLEVLGAMGLREVRRLRGEIGRAMFQSDLEREAFAGIEGYGD